MWVDELAAVDKSAVMFQGFGLTGAKGDETRFPPAPADWLSANSCARTATLKWAARRPSVRLMGTCEPELRIHLDM